MYHRLERTFFARDTHTVARELLGKLLVRRWRNKNMIGRIVEVESYVGEDDAACHAAPRKSAARSRGRRARTPRTEIMYGEAGHAYVYLVYGMHHCLNVVTDVKDFPAAVLIRSLAPVKNISSATDGPGKLTRALHITRAHNEHDVTVSDKLFVADDGFGVTADEIITAPRIGVAYAGEDALLPWRYVIKDKKQNKKSA